MIETGLTCIFFFLSERAIMLPKLKSLELYAVSQLYREHLGRREKAVLNPNGLTACSTLSPIYNGREIWESLAT